MDRTRQRGLYTPLYVYASLFMRPGSSNIPAVLRRKIMLSKAAISAIFSTLLLVGVTFAQQMKQTTKSNNDTLSSVDRNFISSAEEANLGEIETAKIVEQKATDPAVIVSRRRALSARHAVRKMKEVPSEPPCRRRLQTALSCFSFKGCGGERWG
jgi:hypothetical protein